MTGRGGRQGSPAAVRLPADGMVAVWVLAATSFLADASGEMLAAVLPLLLVSEGATGLALGLVAGVTEGFGHAAKLMSGYLGRKPGRAKRILASGYLLAALSHVGVALATTWPGTLLFRTGDRVGKGLRATPRDVLLSEEPVVGGRRRAFLVHRVMDRSGALLGVAAAIALVVGLHRSPREAAVAAAALGFLALVPIAWLPRSQAVAVSGAQCNPSPRLGNLLVASATLSVGRIGPIFFMVFAAGGATTHAAMYGYLAFIAAYLAFTYPGSKLARRAPTTTIASGAVAGALAALLAVWAAVPWWAAFLALGLSYGMLEGNLRVLAADLAGEHDLSARMGLFHAVNGMAAAAGGVAAGLLWDEVAPGWAFGWGALFCILGAGLFIRLGRTAPGNPAAA